MKSTPYWLLARGLAPRRRPIATALRQVRDKQAGKQASRQAGRLAGWQAGRLAGWLAGLSLIHI
eukprot:3090249-Alexandrium_andersonii.AAC.1